MPKCPHFLEIDPKFKVNCSNCARWDANIMRCGKEDEYFRLNLSTTEVASVRALSIKG